MTLQAGKMYRPSDISVDVFNDTVYVVEQFNHRVSKWNYTPGSFTFTLDAGNVISIDFTGGGGTLYSVSDPVNISAPTLDIANPVNATAEVGSVDGGGAITGITITNSGNGYDPNNLPTVVAPTSGTPAILAAVVSTPWGSNGDGTTGKGGPIGDGGPTDISLYRPSGITLDVINNKLYVTDTFHNRVRAINSTTGAFVESFGSGGFGTADFYHPAGIAIDDFDATTLVIADELNFRAIKYDVNSGSPNNPLVLPDPSTGSGLSFVRPHGVVFDAKDSEFNVGDSLRGVISGYNVAGIFQSQYGTPGTTANNVNLFYPGSGEGLYRFTDITSFADTRNNAIKGMTNKIITITTGDGTPGTGDGQLYYPESAASFFDTANYVLVANTLNNRVEIFSNVTTVLTAQSPFNFGKP